MPELPEVETYRRLLEETSMHQTITDFTATDPKRQLLLPYDAFREVLIGRQMVKTTRIGKHLLVGLDNGKVLSLHFGMTGGLHYYRLAEDAPRFERAVFFLENGFKLAFEDSRKFGRIGYWESEEIYIKAKALGPDALEITADGLGRSLQKRKSPVKAALLDQKILAGIGNWLADEVLFQAHIHPEKPASEITTAELKRLVAAMQTVLTTSIEKEAVYRELPGSFLIHAREWDASPHPEKDAHLHCPDCRQKVVKTVVGGRATYLCPGCQK
jgi:formamidopyrimidine-DNA glycosylase